MTPTPAGTQLFDRDTFVAIGVIVTALISLLNLGYSFRHNRRASYVSSVTATRLKWIGDVRDHLSTFVAAVYEAAVAPPADPALRRKLFEQIMRDRMLIRLQLAPVVAKLDRDFEAAIEATFELANTATPQTTKQQLDDLVSTGQAFLWTEWLKVKNEAIHGDPYDTLGERAKRWLAGGSR